MLLLVDFVQIMLLQVSPVELTSISFSVLRKRKKNTLSTRARLWEFRIAHYKKQMQWETQVVPHASPKKCLHRYSGFLSITVILSCHLGQMVMAGKHVSDGQTMVYRVPYRTIPVSVIYTHLKCQQRGPVLSRTSS